jgi:adenosylcobinamide amidohydrolase
MKQFDLVGEGVRLVLKENVLAVLSDVPLATVSSAFHQGGGLKDTKTILNVEVLKSCSDLCLHDDPDAYIVSSAVRLGFTEGFIGMVTAAAVENFSSVSKRDGDLGVSVVVTAADNAGNTCNHAETAGETIESQHTEGTINIIVVVDGNPTESCLVGSLITATEAKMAALKELDIRSRYSGDEATGTVTDAVLVAKTGRGAPIVYAGPASRLGQLVGYCTKKAVREAVKKANECMPSRSVMVRLRERHVSVERMASELAKVRSLYLTEEALRSKIVAMLRDEPLAASFLLAAVKLDEDVEKGLVPPELGRIEETSRRFGALFSKQTLSSVSVEFDVVDLPPFLKQALIGLLASSVSGEKTENLK